MVQVIGQADDDTWWVIVGPGIGMLDGGSHEAWPTELIPPAARLPNGRFWLVGWEKRVEPFDDEQT